MPGWTSCSDVRSKRVKPPLIFLGQSYMQDGFFWIKKLCILRHYCTWFRKKAAGPKIHHKLYSVRGLFIWTWKFMVIFQASSMHVQWNCSHKWVMDRNTHKTTSVLEFSPWLAYCSFYDSWYFSGVLAMPPPMDDTKLASDFTSDSS